MRPGIRTTAVFRALQEALAIIVDAMQAYFTPVRFYSRHAAAAGLLGAAGAAGRRWAPLACVRLRS